MALVDSFVIISSIVALLISKPEAETVVAKNCSLDLLLTGSTIFLEDEKLGTQYILQYVIMKYL